MKIRLFIIALLVLMLAVPALGIAESDAQPRFEVTLPAGYETDGQNYPVIYLLPQNGFDADDSGLTEKLIAAMEAGLGTDMIIVRPVFTQGGDAKA